MSVASCARRWTPRSVVSALLGTFYADYLAGRFAVDEPGAPGWAEAAVDVILAGATG